MIPKVDDLYRNSGTIVLDPEQLEIVCFNYHVDVSTKRRSATIEVTLRSRSTGDTKTIRFDGVDMVYMPFVDGKYAITIANNRLRQWEDRGEFEAQITDEHDLQQVLFTAKAVSDSTSK